MSNPVDRNGTFRNTGHWEVFDEEEAARIRRELADPRHASRLMILPGHSEVLTARTPSYVWVLAAVVGANLALTILLVVELLVRP